MNPLVQVLTTGGSKLLTELETIYKDIHRHPELSMQEIRTAKLAADYIEALGYDVTRAVGVTGVVGVLRNGSGPTVMLRADMDALPMEEKTDLPYASTVKGKDDDGVEVGVAHSCGHDLHVTWLLGASRIFAEHRDAWKGTVMLVFQPGEEVARGAASMISDWGVGRFPKPDIILGAARHGRVERHCQLPLGSHPVSRGQPKSQDCSAAARTAHSRRPPSIRSLWPLLRRCVCKPLFRVKSPRWIMPY